MSLVTILSMLIAQPGAEAKPVAHPQVPCWTGQRSWTDAGAPASDYVVWDTREEEQPHRIVHNRDQIRKGGALEQDYNFIDYWFGPPSEAMKARFYFKSDDAVSVVLPGDTENLSLAMARKRIPAGVLCYLQKRFDRIEVLVAQGYVELWSLPND